MTRTIDNKKESSSTVQECFVIMPIADPEGYDKGHFTKVYEDIFKPACLKSDYQPVRADEVKQTNLIHLDILQKLIQSPMAICDLSSRNPNVLFELGLRQAFDKPTVLVQEVGTPKIFDIAPLRYTEYRKELKYRDVLVDQLSIAEAINATRESTSKGDGVNSIIKILSLSKPATLKEVSADNSSDLFRLIRAEMSEMRSDFRRTMNTFENNKRVFSGPNNYIGSAVNMHLSEIKNILFDLQRLNDEEIPLELFMEEIKTAKLKLMELMDSNFPERHKKEASQIFSMIHDLENKAIIRSKCR
jgi:hypothetical protein